MTSPGLPEDKVIKLFPRLLYLPIPHSGIPQLSVFFYWVPAGSVVVVPSFLPAAAAGHRHNCYIVSACCVRLERVIKRVLRDKEGSLRTPNFEQSQGGQMAQA